MLHKSFKSFRLNEQDNVINHLLELDLVQAERYIENPKVKQELESEHGIAMLLRKKRIDLLLLVFKIYPSAVQVLIDSEILANSFFSYNGHKIDVAQFIKQHNLEEYIYDKMDKWILESLSYSLHDQMKQARFGLIESVCLSDLRFETSVRPAQHILDDTIKVATMSSDKNEKGKPYIDYLMRHIDYLILELHKMNKDLPLPMLKYYVESHLDMKITKDQFYQLKSDPTSNMNLTKSDIEHRLNRLSQNKSANNAGFGDEDDLLDIF